MNIILVAGGGLLGAVIRFFISNTFNKHVAGTWIANISGSILLAWLYRSFLDESISSTVWLFWGIGFSGAYTTFSTFGSEVIQFIMAKRYTAAFLYSFFSFAIALTFVYILILM